MIENKKKWDIKTVFKFSFNILSIMVGTTFIAFALQVLLGPYTIAGGGVTGLAVILEKLVSIPKYITIFIVSIILFLFGAKIIGAKSATMTLITTISMTVILKFFPTDIRITDNLMLASIFGGVILGVGLGIIFRTGATLGGTDLAGVILSNYFPNFRAATGMGFIDFIVVILAGIIDKNIETSLYSLITVFFCMVISDMILTGSSVFKAFYIISSTPDEVGNALMNKLGRAVTVFNATGMYSSKEKKMLLCVVSRAQFIRCKELIAEIDSEAFIMISDISEVFGLNFQKPKLRRKKQIQRVYR